MGTYKNCWSIIEIWEILVIWNFQICKLLCHQLLTSCSARLLFLDNTRPLVTLLVAQQPETGNQLGWNAELFSLKFGSSHRLTTNTTVYITISHTFFLETMLSWPEAGTGQLLTQKPQIVLALQLYEYEGNPFITE
jgi:hypothetical protein